MSKIGYIRVSTEKQETARQQEIMNNYQVDRIFSEKLSGANTDRPQLKAMLDYVREGDTLYIESISRLGRSAKDLLQLEEFRKIGRTFVTTEDGSAGEKGFVTNHSILAQEHFDAIATCGPKPMMMAVARFAFSQGTPCEASLENLMACGIGACLCCVEKKSDGHNVCVCKEGPIFKTTELQWHN